MKRVLMSLMAGLLLMSLVACGDKSKNCDKTGNKTGDKTCGECKCDSHPKTACCTQPASAASTSATSGDTQLGLFKEMLAVLKTIDSPETAAAAKPKLDAIKERMSALNEQINAVQSEINEEGKRIMDNSEWAVAAGLLPSLEEQEKPIEARLEMLKEYLDILKSIKDKASAEAAKPQLQSFMMKSQMMQMQFSRMPQPTPDQQKKLDAKFEKQRKAIQDALVAEQERLDKNPELMKVFSAPAAPAEPTDAPTK